MSRFLIDADSSIYSMIELANPVNTRLADCEPGEVSISAITFAEIALGTQMQKPPAPEVLKAFLTQIPLLPFDGAAARQYAMLPFKRARFDRLLAAHALSIGATVITNNEGDYSDVPGLQVENWTI
jgi:tRNA(fMet)-specific endonuclease VapC